MTSYPLFGVSPRKFFVMTILTFGLYLIYWWYRQWRVIEEQEAINIIPLMRAIFAIFFCYAFFRRVHDKSVAVILTTVYWLVVLFQNVVSLAFPANQLVLWSVMLFSVIALPSVLYVSLQQINKQIEGVSAAVIDNTFTPKSMAAIALGITVWVFYTMAVISS